MTECQKNTPQEKKTETPQQPTKPQTQQNMLKQWVNRTGYAVCTENTTTIEHPYQKHWKETKASDLRVYCNTSTPKQQPAFVLVERSVAGAVQAQYEFPQKLMAHFTTNKTVPEATRAAFAALVSAHAHKEDHIEVGPKERPIGEQNKVAPSPTAGGDKVPLPVLDKVKPIEKKEQPSAREKTAKGDENADARGSKQVNQKHAAEKTSNTDKPTPKSAPQEGNTPEKKKTRQQTPPKHSTPKKQPHPRAVKLYINATAIPEWSWVRINEEKNAETVIDERRTFVKFATECELNLVDTDGAGVFAFLNDQFTEFIAEKDSKQPPAGECRMICKL